MNEHENHAAECDECTDIRAALVRVLYALDTERTDGARPQRSPHLALQIGRARRLLADALTIAEKKENV